MRRFFPGLLVVALLFAALPLDGVGAAQEGPAGADWPMAGGGAARTGAVAGPGPTDAPAVMHTIGDGVNGYSTDGGLVYAALASGALVALDGASGAEIWRVATGFWAQGAPIVADGTVFAGNGDGEVVALDAATGAERWRAAFDLSGETRALAAADGTLFVPTQGGAFYALDATSGAVRWESRGLIAPAAASGSLVAVDDLTLTVLVGLDPATGAERWRVQLGGAVERPTIADGVVYAGSQDGHAYALDAVTGAERWRFAGDEELWTTPAVADGLVFVASHRGGVYAIDPASGVERWRFTPAPDAPRLLAAATLAAAEGTVVVRDPALGLRALDAATGAERWHVPLPFSQLAPIIAGGRVYVDGRATITAGGTLFALDLATGGETWRVGRPAE